MTRPHLLLAGWTMETLWTQAPEISVVLQQTGGAVLTRLVLLGAHTEVFVAEPSTPARFTGALPWLPAGTVHTPRHRHAALAELAFPAWITSADSELITAAVGDVAAAVASVTCTGRGKDNQAAAAQQEQDSGSLDRQHVGCRWTTSSSSSSSSSSFCSLVPSALLPW